jgi:hypothetical protein
MDVFEGKTSIEIGPFGERVEIFCAKGSVADSVASETSVDGYIQIRIVSRGEENPCLTVAEAKIVRKALGFWIKRLEMK